MPDDTVDIVVTVPRQVAEQVQADPTTCEHLSATGIDEAPMGDEKVWRCDVCGWLHQSVQVEAAGSMVRVLRAAPLPDVVVVDGVRLRRATADWLREWPLGEGPMLTVLRAVRDALLAQEAEPPAPEPIADITVGCRVRTIYGNEGTTLATTSFGEWAIEFDSGNVGVWRSTDLTVMTGVTE